MDQLFYCGIAFPALQTGGGYLDIKPTHCALEQAKPMTIGTIGAENLYEVGECDTGLRMTSPSFISRGRPVPLCAIGKTANFLFFVIDPLIELVELCKKWIVVAVILFVCQFFERSYCSGALI